MFTGLRWLLIIVVILMSSVTSIATAQQSIRVVSYPIPLLIEDAENGVFVSLLKELAERAGVKYTLEIFPAKRAMLLFDEGAAMAIIPALLGTLSKEASLTSQIFSKNIHGLVLEGTAIPRSVEELKYMRVGLVRGYSYPRSIVYNNNIIIDYADTTEASLKKLVEKRVEVIVVDGTTARHAIQKLGLNGVKYDLSAILHSQPAFIAFQPTTAGKALAARFSKAIQSMREDGTYDLIVPKVE